MQRRLLRIIIITFVVIVVIIGIYYIPPIHNKLAWRVEETWANIRFFFNPPEDAVFVPTGQTSVDIMVTQTLLALLTPSPSGIVDNIVTPTITSTPLPESISLPGVVYVDQHNRWNYCGPSNLTMALKFWGWDGNRDDVSAVVKPGINDPTLDFIQRGRLDKNVMPTELVDFVNYHTEFRALLRYGGDINLLKRLLAAGYPVVVEKGYFAHDTTGAISWMGHYQFITGYDDTKNNFLVQDAYEYGPNYRIPYDEFQQGWRAFNYLFFLVHPLEQEEHIYELLGNWGDINWAAQHALDIAMQEIRTLSGVDQYFAWFNVGTSNIQLFQYSDAASAYDQAFQLYAALEGDDIQRPYRLLWYQTGPYKAYYYTERYSEIINLAGITLASIRDGPTLEESLYWRALAEYKLGQYEAAYEDMRRSVYLNTNFDAGWNMLQEWGISP